MEKVLLSGRAEKEAPSAVPLGLDPNLITQLKLGCNLAQLLRNPSAEGETGPGSLTTLVFQKLQVNHSHFFTFLDHINAESQGHKTGKLRDKEVNSTGYMQKIELTKSEV